MLKSYKLVVGLILVSTITVILVLNRSNHSSEVPKIIQIGNNKYSIEIANTEKSRSLGLSGRTSINKNQGMLFVFPSPSNYLFWMKEMNFPLDFVWIDGDKVVDVTQNVPKQANSDLNSLTTFTAKSPFDKVVELYAGTVEADNIKIGDIIKL